MDHNIDAQPIRRPHDPVPDPTPAEIAERSAEIRAGWDEETRQARLAGRACSPSNEDQEAGRRAEAMARAALL